MRRTVVISGSAIEVETEDIGPGDLQETDGYQTIYHQQLGPRSLAQCHLFQLHELPDAYPSPYPWEAWWKRPNTL